MLKVQHLQISAEWVLQNVLYSLLIKEGFSIFPYYCSGKLLRKKILKTFITLVLDFLL